MVSEIGLTLGPQCENFSLQFESLLFTWKLIKVTIWFIWLSRYVYGKQVKEHIKDMNPKLSKIRKERNTECKEGREETLLTVPPTVSSGVWRKLLKLPEIPPSIYIKKNVNEPYPLQTWGPNVRRTQHPRVKWKMPLCCTYQLFSLGINQNSRTHDKLIYIYSEIS